MTTPSLPHRIKSDRERATRLAAYELNRRYYEGKHRIRNTTRRHKTVVNLCEVLVDTVVAHLGSARVAWGDDAAANAHDEHLTDVLNREGSELLDETAETSACVLGDGAWKVTWDDEQRRVRLATIDPSSLHIDPTPGDPTTPALVAQFYEITPDWAPVLLPNGAILPATGTRKIEVCEVWTPDRLQFWANDRLAFDDTNPYGAIPYCVFPNLRLPWQTWGRSDVARLIDLQDAYNDAHADLDDMMQIANAILLVYGSESEDLSVQPGVIWEMPEASRVEVLDLLQNSSSDARHTYLDRLRVELGQQARVPDLALGLDDIASASGTALQIQLGPLLRLVARKRLSRSQAHRHRARLIARLGTLYQGLPPAEHLAPSVYWTEAIPSDRSVELANATAELALGVSRETLISRIGYDDATAELTRRHQEDMHLGPDRQQQPATTA